MAPRFRPLTKEQKGLERIFKERGLDLEMFTFLVSAGLKDAPIAKALSADRRKRTGIELNISSRTIKGYRSLL